MNTLGLLLTLLFTTSLLIFACPNANASTTMEYESSCEYFDAKGKQLSKTCIVNFGIIGVDRGLRYILMFPNKTEVWIYHYSESGETKANGIPASIAFGKNKVVVVTEQDEIFIFEDHHGKEDWRLKKNKP